MAIKTTKGRAAVVIILGGLAIASDRLIGHMQVWPITFLLLFACLWSVEDERDYARAKALELGALALAFQASATSTMQSMIEDFERYVAAHPPTEKEMGAENDTKPTVN